MPIIQDFPAELNYVNAKLHPLAPKSGAFLECFLNAALRADLDNYPLIQPILRVFMLQYPADAERLEREIQDNYRNEQAVKP